MIKLLWRILIGGCDHTWETFNKKSVFEGDSRDEDGSLLPGRRDLPICTTYHMRCTKCGNLKYKRLR